MKDFVTKKELVNSNAINRSLDMHRFQAPLMFHEKCVTTASVTIEHNGAARPLVYTATMDENNSWLTCRIYGISNWV